jgi:hypothetical protein
MRHFAFAAICTCASALALTASAQEQSRPSLPTQQAPDSYVPDLGELMTVTQLRHFKLSYAAELNNWELANYEVAQVRKSFDAAAKFYPVLQNVQQAKLIADVSEPALKAIEKSINAKDRAAFEISFNDLTSACNSCHQQANIGFVVIRVPTSSPFSNQVFPPTQK